MHHINLPISTSIQTKKPNTLHRPDDYCPFCDIKSLKENNQIVSAEGSQIWIRNKFPVIKNAESFVFIEHDSCELNITNYPKNILLNVIHSSVSKWLEMMNDDRFKSVLLFKNHGLYSSGSIHHPHMQLIGLHDIDIYSHLSLERLEGESIRKEKGFDWSISLHPFTEFYEFTIRLSDMRKLDRMAHAIQSSTHYIVNHLSPFHKSFNLCFYHVKDEIIVKVFNRRPQSPFSFGFGLAQLPDDIPQKAEEIRSHYPFTE